jgi:hypothetical protein
MIERMIALPPVARSCGFTRNETDLIRREFISDAEFQNLKNESTLPSTFLPGQP